MSTFFQIDPKSINTLLKDQGLKRWWVAEQAGIHKTTLRRWLNGRINKVRHGHVVRLAQVLTTSEQTIARPLRKMPYPTGTLLD